MGTWVIKVVLVFCFCNTGLGIHASDKLDFGDTPHSVSLVKSEKKFPVKVTRTIDTLTSPSEHISVSCGSTGCNNTNNNNNNNSVETEVVVRVKTNINLDKSHNRKDLEDVSDVPVVVGYKGSTPDETPNEEQFRSYSPISPDPNDASSRGDYTPLRPLYTGSPTSSGRVYGDYGSTRRDYIPYKPLYTASPVSIGGGYGRRELSSETPYNRDSLNYGSQTNEYSGSEFSTTPKPYGYYGSTRTISSRIPNGYYDSASQRTEGPNNYYDNYDILSRRSEVPNNYYEISSPRTVEINGISSPLSAPIPILNRRNYDYNTDRDNQDELQIPYYEHTYNKHYFGEEPPPHTILYPKSNSFNPVEFRDIPKNQWRPSVWEGRPNKYAFSNAGKNIINAYTHNHNRPIPYSQINQRGHGDTGCACREQRTDDESNPYAAASVHHHHIAVQKKEPGASIDDKLAPLN